MTIPQAQDEVWSQLISAAVVVFAREGYGDTRLVDIVSEAGLSTEALFGRFRSKSDLLCQAIIQRAMACPDTP
jgi:AcrR family transcriptional regulator